MKHSLPLLCLLVLLQAGFICTAQAQDKPANVTVDFTVIALGDKPVTDLQYKSGGQLVSFKAPSYVRSTSYKYTGPTTMAFYRMVADKDGRLQPVEAGKVMLPTAGGRVLLLLVPGAGTDYTMGAVADGAGALPLGKTRIYNATTIPLSVLCNNTQKVLLKPFEAETIDSKDGGIVANVSMQQDGQWKSAVSNIYLVGKDQKLNLFLLSSYTHTIVSADVQMFRLMEGKVPPPSGGFQSVKPAANRGGAGG